MGDIKDSQTQEGIVPSIAPEYVRLPRGSRILRNGEVHLLLYLGMFIDGMEIKVCYLLIIRI